VRCAHPKFRSIGRHAAGFDHGPSCHVAAKLGIADLLFEGQAMASMTLIALPALLAGCDSSGVSTLMVLAAGLAT